MIVFENDGEIDPQLSKEQEMKSLENDRLVFQGLGAIQIELEAMRRELVAKGHSQATVSLSMESSGALQLCLRTGSIAKEGERALPGHWPYDFVRGQDWDEVQARAWVQVHGCKEAEAQAAMAWFEPQEAGA